MENTKANRRIYLFTIIAWLLFMLFYGWSYTANPELPTNSTSSPAFSFISTYGLFSIQLLSLILLFEVWAIENPPQRIKNYLLKRAPDIKRWALNRVATAANETAGIKKVLNVGGNSKEIPLPPEYAGFEHLLLDIDPRGLPDIVCDARELITLKAAQFEAV